MLFHFEMTAGNAPVLRRICTDKQNNTLYFFPSNDTCPSFISYVIWGRESATSSFSIIDSVKDKNANTYTHINANPSGNPKKWSYYVLYIDSCSGMGSISSDTLKVDDTPPDSAFIRIVSVNPLTNKVRIIWEKNKSPDFYRYLLYHDSLTFWNEIGPVVQQDTIYDDLSAFADPTLGTITYDLTAMDSCGSTRVFGYNPHTTIFLKSIIDTCKSSISLYWSGYVGWNKIDKHYIWRDNGAGYVIIDSVGPNIFTYTDIFVNGISYKYYVSAKKWGEENTISNSNSISFLTRKRIDPTSTNITSVDALNPDGDIARITITSLPGQEYKAIALYESIGNSFSILTSKPYTSGEITHDFTLPNIDNTYKFKAKGINLCNEETDESPISITFRPVINDQSGQNNLIWQQYKFWDTGVNKYRIYRGTNSVGNAITFTVIDSVNGSDTIYNDINPPLDLGDRGACYYVEAIQNPGSVYGKTNTAKSFCNCLVGNLVVFIPNAFTPQGYNPIFRPEGSFLDYENSTMDIFNRWGENIFSLKGIVNGWNGEFPSGIPAPAGVYLYRIKAVSTNGQQITKTGSVTLLR